MNNVDSVTLNFSELEMATPPVDVTTGHSENQGLYDSLIQPTLDNPIPTIGLIAVLSVVAIAARRALHRNPRPWLEDR